ncbi:MAG: hypothetical protein LBN27_03905 [Prevotellaceae bacterium]|jgi:hypothetical protein|nr:hypothetical protein [Prevotellaceae bacterium]
MKTTKLMLLVGTIVLLLATSCKKEDPQPEQPKYVTTTFSEQFAGKKFILHTNYGDEIWNKTYEVTFEKSHPDYPSIVTQIGKVQWTFNSYNYKGIDYLIGHYDTYDSYIQFVSTTYWLFKVIDGQIVQYDAWYSMKKFQDEDFDRMYGIVIHNSTIEPPKETGVRLIPIE